MALVESASETLCSEANGIVARLVSALSVGSYLVLAHPASDIRRAKMAEMTKR